MKTEDEILQEIHPMEQPIPLSRQRRARRCRVSDTPIADKVRKLIDVYWDGEYRQEEAEELADKVATIERELTEAMERLAIISNIWHKLDEAIKSAPAGAEEGKGNQR